MSGTVRFGIYALDPEGMTLLKNGSRIRLQEQPFHVLLSLVERPGEVVTREQLRERIWSKDTFVEYDQSLNKAVNRLRAVSTLHIPVLAGHTGWVTSVALSTSGDVVASDSWDQTVKL